MLVRIEFNHNNNNNKIMKHQEVVVAGAEAGGELLVRERDVVWGRHWNVILVLVFLVQLRDRYCNEDEKNTKTLRK